MKKKTLKGIEPDPFKEAFRYLDNAKECIAKAKLDPVLKLYMDKKYVRMAGNTVWNGCLVALEAVFGAKSTMKNSLKNDFVVWQVYQEAYGKKGGNMDFFKASYRKTHILLGYNGEASELDFLDVIRTAKIIIENCKQWYKEKKQ